MNAPKQRALVIFHVFKGQVSNAVLDLFEEHKIVVTFIPANMTHQFQWLDMTVNGYTKKYPKRKFNEWYTDQVYQQYVEKKKLRRLMSSFV